jgi:DHA1 family tetracycline resistance protein-like MFS transporter
MSKQRYTVLALFVTILVDAIGWGVAFPVLAPIILSNTTGLLSPDVSIATRNFLYEFSLGIYCLFMFLMVPILGSLSDKYGRKKILIISMLGNFLGFFISGIAIACNSFDWILIGRAIAGATSGSFPIAQAAVMDISENDVQKASYLGMVVLANTAGFAIGPVIGGFFMDPNIFSHISYQLPFFVSCATALCGALLLWLGFKETFQGNRSLKIHPMGNFISIYNAFTMKTTAALCVVLLCFIFGWGMFFSTIPVLLTERLHWLGSSIGYFITYIAVFFAVIVMIIMPKVMSRFPIPKVVMIALCSMLIGSLVFPTAHNSIIPWFTVLFVMAVPFTYVGTVTLLSMQVDSQKQGEIMGVTGSIFALAFGLGPILVGSLLHAGLTAPFMACAVFFIAGIIVMGMRMRKN